MPPGQTSYLSLPRLATREEIAQAIVKENLANIQARLDEYSKDPRITSLYEISKISMSGNFEGFGDRVFTPEEVDIIIHKSSMFNPRCRPSVIVIP